jgi:hypothetical protein
LRKRWHNARTSTLGWYSFGGKVSRITKGGENSTILTGEINIKALRASQKKLTYNKHAEDKKDFFKPTPPGFDKNHPRLTLTNN